MFGCQQSTWASGTAGTSAPKAHDQNGPVTGWNGARANWNEQFRFPRRENQGHLEIREDKQESRRNRVAGVVTRINAGKKIWVEFRDLKRNESGKPGFPDRFSRRKRA